jgi:hypothetical protein
MLSNKSMGKRLTVGQGQSSEGRVDSGLTVPECVFKLYSRYWHNPSFGGPKNINLWRLLVDLDQTAIYPDA